MSAQQQAVFEKLTGKRMELPVLVNASYWSGRKPAEAATCPTRAGWRAALTGLSLLALVLAVPASAGTLYRYINDKGYQEIGYSVPPHLVPNGYDVIDESGRLLRRVSPQLSEEEYAAKLERERKLEACEKSKERVHRRYETMGDIDKAEAQFETQLAESLKNIQANLDYTNTELSKQQTQAASLERSGKLIPKNLLDAIDASEEIIATLTAQKQAGERSRLDKASEFEEERRVFQLGGCDEDRLAAAN